MPKVSTKRKKDTNPQDDQDIFAHFGFQNEPEQKEKPEVASDEPKVSDLLGQIKALQDQMHSIQQTNMTLMTQAPQVERTTTSNPITFDGLPDPVTETDAYNKALAQRVQGLVAEAVRSERDQYSSKDTLAKKAEQLWEDFGNAYEDYASDQTKVEFAASKVVQRMASRGVDVNKYMFSARDEFFRDLTKEYKTIFGDPTKGSKEDDREESEEEVSRTDGIFGGAESGGRPSFSEPKPGDMIKDIHDMQRKTGFF